MLNGNSTDSITYSDPDLTREMDLLQQRDAETAMSPFLKGRGIEIEAQLLRTNRRFERVDAPTLYVASNSYTWFEIYEQSVSLEKFCNSFRREQMMCHWF